MCFEFAPTTCVESNNYFMHVAHDKNVICDSYIVEFVHDATESHYERGKYGGRNFHVTKLPLVMLRLLLFLSSSLHMLVFACRDNLFTYKMPMHRKYVRLKCVFHMLHDALLCVSIIIFHVSINKFLCLARGIKRWCLLGGNPMNKFYFCLFLSALECLHNYSTTMIVFFVF